MSSLRLLIAVAVTAIMLIAPVMFVELTLVRPPLAAAAHAYDADPCTGLVEQSHPFPVRPNPGGLHHHTTPCAVVGAMVTEKDTISTGPAGITRYALGVRTDGGAEFSATLAGDRAVDLFNAMQPGDRVVVQTLRGQVVLVGDGTRTVPTDTNPDTPARNNAVALWITGVLCVLEVLALAIFAALRRRS